MAARDTNPARDSDFAARASDSYARLRELFAAAAELDGDERARWMCANVPDPEERIALERLLSADLDKDGYFDISLDEHAARMAVEEPMRPDGLIGEHIGAFRLTRLLGQGGMATVFLGERESDFRQHVAVKLLRRGLYSEIEQRLFRRERQLLAGLDHPNIARLVDGGVTAAGIPYLVIEYVDGEAITKHAARHALDVRERLALFLIVCRAVEAAHRALIVHRDIKPSNILVTAEGSVKLLDFGIAKLLEDDADNATMGVFTPEYAAPEQLANALVTTATDVYSLGVLLHELLIGIRPPREQARRPSQLVAEAARHISVPRPAQLVRGLRGDLDTIVLKCLAEEPERRYASAGALADDIQRHLIGKPVEAHPPSRWYRARKFLRRHRVSVAITALLVAAVFAALGTTLWQAQVARHEAERANSVRDFLVSLLDTARAHLPRDQRPTPEALVEQAQRQVAANGVDVATRADLLRTLGEVELSLDQFDHAATLFDDAAANARQVGDVSAERFDHVMHAEALQRWGRNGEAIAEIGAQLDALRAQASPALPRALGVLSEAELFTAAMASAIEHRREAAAAVARLSGADSLDALAATLEVGETLAAAQSYPDAIAVLKPGLERWRARGAPEDDRYVVALESLAGAEDGVGERVASEVDFRTLLELKRRIYKEPHDSIARTLRDIGAMLLRQEKYTEAGALFDESLSMLRQLYGDEHAQIAETYVQMGYAEILQLHYATGDDDYRKAIALCQHGQFRTDACARAPQNLGQSLYRQQRYPEARAALADALAAYRQIYGDDHPNVAYPLSSLANVAVRMREPDEALRLSAEAQAQLERGGRGASREAVLLRSTRAEALSNAGRKDEALTEMDALIADWRHIDPEAKSRLVWWLVMKAQILADLQRSEDARKVAEEAIGLGVDPKALAPVTKEWLRKLSGRADIYPEVAEPPTARK